jgi:hypothetical protein
MSKRIVPWALLAILVLAPHSGCRSGGGRELREVTTRWRLLFDSHDLASFTSLYAPHGAYATPGMAYPVHSPEELRGVLETIWRNTPDMRIAAIHSLVAEGDRIGFVWELNSTPPMATKPIKTFGATFLRLAEGKIVEQLTVTAR